MSVTSLTDYRREHVTEAQLRQSIVEVTHRRVLAMLKGKVCDSLIVSAQDIADADVREGMPVGRAAAHAAAWAMARKD